MQFLPYSPLPYAMATDARKITVNGLAASCQLFYRKIYGIFLQFAGTDETPLCCTQPEHGSTLSHQMSQGRKKHTSRPGLEPRTSRTQFEHSDHWATEPMVDLWHCGTGTSGAAGTEVTIISFKFLAFIEMPKSSSLYRCQSVCLVLGHRNTFLKIWLYNFLLSFYCQLSFLFHCFEVNTYKIDPNGAQKTRKLSWMKDLSSDNSSVRFRSLYEAFWHFRVISL